MNDGENILRIRKIVEFECKQNARGEQNEEKKNVDRITKILNIQIGYAVFQSHDKLL